MALTFGKYGPAHPGLGILASPLNSLLPPLCAAARFYRADHSYARASAIALKETLNKDEPAYLLGIGPSAHNSGIALVEVSRQRGVVLLSNNEQERFSGIKHDTSYPELAIEAVLSQMRTIGIHPKQIHACLASW